MPKTSLAMPTHSSQPRNRWTTSLWFNAVWFQCLWFSCVLGGATWLPFSAVWLLAYIIAVRPSSKELTAAAAVALLGVAIDSGLSITGVYNFTAETLLPGWLLVLWVGFAIALGRSMRFIGKHWALAALCGAIAMPLNYGAGERLGAVVYGLPLSATILMQAAIWALALPMMSAFSAKLWNGEQGSPPQ